MAENIEAEIKQKLKAYESDVKNFRETDDPRMREKLNKERLEVCEDVEQFTERMKNLI